MIIAVAGGTGVVGRHVVAVAREAGHEPVVLSRARGTDLLTGVGLVEALLPAQVLIDVSNTRSITKAGSVGFFEAATTKLLAAGREAGIQHHVALSIVGIDRVASGYYEGKRRQEGLVIAGAVPWTILRATQFHEFPAQLLARLRGPVAPVPEMRTQPVAAREVAEHLVRLATGDPVGQAPDLAGPQVHDLPDLVRRLLNSRGQRRLVVPVRSPGPVGTAMATDGLLPQSDGPRGVQTFDEWLVASV